MLILATIPSTLIFTCEPSSFNSGRNGFVWVRRVCIGSADLKSRQIRGAFPSYDFSSQNVKVQRKFTNKCLLFMLTLYRVSQEEWTKVREGVPYVKLYRINPKHLCPKLNGYWDNGQIQLRTSFGSTNDSCQLVNIIYTARRFGDISADARLKCISLHMSGRQAVSKPGDVTAQHSSVMYRTSNPMYNFYTNARNFAGQMNGFISLTSYFDVKYRY